MSVWSYQFKVMGDDFTNIVCINFGLYLCVSGEYVTSSSRSVAKCFWQNTLYKLNAQLLSL